MISLTSEDSYSVDAVLIWVLLRVKLKEAVFLFNREAQNISLDVYPSYQCSLQPQFTLSLRTSGGGTLWSIFFILGFVLLPLFRLLVWMTDVSSCAWSSSCSWCLLKVAGFNNHTFIEAKHWSLEGWQCAILMYTYQCVSLRCNLYLAVKESSKSIPLVVVSLHNKWSAHWRGE